MNANTYELVRAETAAKAMETFFDAEGTWQASIGAELLAQWGGGNLCVSLYTTHGDGAWWLITVGDNTNRYRAQFLFDNAATAFSACAHLRVLAEL